jgi:DNA-binding CsgD family transcriptional regulator
MVEIVIVYWIACYSIGLMGLALSLAAFIRDRDRAEGAFVLLMLSFTLLVAATTVQLIVEKAGGRPLGMMVSDLIQIIGLTGLYHALPRFTNTLAGFSWSKRMDRITAASAIAMGAILGAARFVLESRPFPAYRILYAVAFCLEILAIVYASLSGALARAIMKEKLDETYPRKWRNITKAIIPLTFVCLPLFVILDFDAWPGLRNVLPWGIRAFPGFYAFWSSIYLVESLRRGRGKPARAERDLVIPDEVRPEDIDAARFALSPRETEVACLLLSGLAYKEISTSIGVSMATVKTHVARIYQKTGASTKLELMKFLARRQNSPSSAERTAT